MFQNVLSANHSKERANCIFGRGDAGQLLILQRYNRVFIYQDGLPKTVHLYSAAAKKLTPAMLNKRKKSGEAVIQHDQEALSVLKANGLGNLQKAGRLRSRKFLICHLTGSCTWKTGPSTYFKLKSRKQFCIRLTMTSTWTWWPALMKRTGGI